MSFKNKLGRTVSYSVLLAGVLAAGNALSADPAGTQEDPLTSLPASVDTSSDNVYFKGDVNLNNNEGGQQNVTVSGSNKLNIMEGSNITISGTHDVAGEGGRNSINGYPNGGTVASESGIVFDKGVRRIRVRLRLFLFYAFPHKR